jgi:hypothetical protein
MDHAEARELIELAAVEPAGLDRLMAGDTAEAAAVAGHVAGCPECAAEVVRLRRAASVIRTVVRTTPPEDLRERTLAYVAQVGRPRAGITAAAGAGAARTVATVPGTGTAPRPETSVGNGREPRAVAGEAATAGARNWRPAAWLASLAAVVVISVAATGFVLNDRIDRQGLAINGLAQTSAWTMRLTAAADTRRVELAGPGGATGSLLFSPASDELVVVATGLAEPGHDVAIRCWVEQNGERMKLGRMYVSGGVAYWAGEAAGLDGIGPGAVFGVSLDTAGDGVSGDPLMTGRL